MSVLDFASENRTTVIVAGGAVLIAGALGFILTHSSRSQPAPPPPPMTMVIIQPPKPPPPPPPQQQKTITPPKMTTPAMKPITPTQTPPKAPSESHVGTSIHGNGPNAFDLSGTPGGMGFGDGEGGGGSALSYFEGVISGQIRNALQNNPITRKASAGLQIYLWIDASGTVTQVQLMKSSGDPNVDDAVTNQVLPGMKLSDLPPAGTPMPISISLTGQSPL